MKKTLIAVFSISVTAGTLYLTYSQVKEYFIKKLVKSWQEEAKKQNKELTDTQVKQLKDELDKLFLWEVKQLANYSEKAINRQPEAIIALMIKKLKERKILEKANLKAVDSILFGT